MDLPFTPIGNNVPLASTTTAGTDQATLDVPSGNVSSLNLRIVNNSDKTQFIKPGTSTVTASSTTSLPVLPGEDIIICVPPNTTTVASVVESGTATGKIHFQCGRGT